MVLHKILKIVAILLGLLGVVLWVSILASDGAGVAGLIVLAYIILFLVLALVLFFVLKGIFQGNIKKTLLSIGAFLVIMAISYGISNGDPVMSKEGVLLAEGSTSRWVGAGLNMFYILAIVAVGAMILSGFKRIRSK